MRVIISGGGTGGHIFPAIAIAKGLQEDNPNVEILFVGAEGRMEMEKIPSAGYEIVGLPIAGLQRKFTWKNLLLPFKILKSMRKATQIIKSFKPDVCVGVGGYASGPLLRAAQRKNIPTLIQEQNSYAGMTNKLLAKQAHVICVAYERMERFFPKDKIVLTGNPVRRDLFKAAMSKTDARVKMGLDPNKSTVLIVGGSLGARTLNETMKAASAALEENPQIQWVWQAGRNNVEHYRNCKTAQLDQVQCTAFIEDMNAAYAAADLVICRAGALTISEICVIGKAAILVPSPHVAEDHQTQNALSLVNQQAAKLVRDADAKHKLMEEALYLIKHPKALELLEREVKLLGLPNAVEQIVTIIKRIKK